ncbi:hypothetical protein PG984_009811 [Apiospora sp. TS-2023a]
MDDGSDDPSLGGQIEAFLGIERSGNATAGSGLRTLFLLLYSHAGNPPLAANQDFIETLSTPERYAATLLDEWWTRDIDAELANDVKPYLFAHALAHILFDGSGPDGKIAASAHMEEMLELEQLMLESERATWRAVVQLLDGGHEELHFKTRERVITVTPNTMTTIRIGMDFYGSTYHRDMLELFAYELIILITDRSLSSATRKAAQSSAIMRLGYTCLSHVTTHFESSYRYPLGMQDTPLQIKKCHVGLSTIPNPCNWLPKDSVRRQIPRYLWNIKKGCTVDTNTMQREYGAISYSIISHTWGRWRKDGDGADVPGVPLWKVPENTMFDVQRLPRIIRDMGFAVRFIWMDLLCIPQNRYDSKLAPIAQLELARQAEIFRNADTVVAWLTDLESWADAEANIAWLALTYLHDGPRDFPEGMQDRLACATDGLRDAASRSSGFHWVQDSEKEQRRVPGWMSSLWTLQEAFIRPDMILMSRDFELLSVGKNTAITLDLLVTLVFHIYFDRDWRQEDSGYADAPQGVESLALLILDAGLVDLIRGDRMTPLVTGSVRQATASRGEAIMAVTGAVEWHLGRSVTQFRDANDTDDLLLGLYPFEFIQELIGLCGGFFFMCEPVRETLICTTQGLEDPGFQGTMLPFIKDGLGTSRATVAGDNDNIYRDHESVKTWNLKQDGSVRLSEAGIVTGSSTHIMSGSRGMGAELNFDASVMINNWDPSDVPRRTFSGHRNLRDVVQSLPNEAVAVCVRYTDHILVGLILQRFTPGSGPFVKAGIFSLVNTNRKSGSAPTFTSSSIPESVPVDW